MVNLISELSPHEAPPMAVDPETIRDVYLGGSCGLTTWRTAIAAPILRFVLIVDSYVIKIEHKSVNIFLFVGCNICFWCSIEPSY